MDEEYLNLVRLGKRNKSKYLYYVVIAYYRGNREALSYPVFLGKNVEDAKNAAEKQATFRGGLYSCVVYEMKEGAYDEQCIDSEIPYIKEVYETQIPHRYK